MATFKLPDGLTLQLPRDIFEAQITFLTGEEDVRIALISNDEVVGYAMMDVPTGEYVAMLTPIQGPARGTVILHDFGSTDKPVEDNIMEDWRTYER